MIKAWPALRTSNERRSAFRSAACRTTGKAWYRRKEDSVRAPLKYSDLAMLQVSFLGMKAGTRGGSIVPEWLGQMISGPLRGTFSTPTAWKRPIRYVRVMVRINQRSDA